MEVLKTYSITNEINLGDVNIAKLHAEIIAIQCITDYASLAKNGDELEVWGGTLDNEPSLDNIVYDHIAFNLDEYKQPRFIEIKENNEYLRCKHGFVFDSNSFSLDSVSVTKWNTVMNQTVMFTFPLEITTKDFDTYNLESADVIPFWGSAMGAHKAISDTGRPLQKAIFDAVDKAGVDAVVDTRQ